MIRETVKLSKFFLILLLIYLLTQDYTTTKLVLDKKINLEKRDNKIENRHI